jgi:hypothetical protein
VDAGALQDCGTDDRVEARSVATACEDSNFHISIVAPSRGLLARRALDS